MEWSRHNIVAPLTDTDKYYIVNLLSGHADILDRLTWEQLQQGMPEEHKEWERKGYLVDPAQEKQVFRDKYLTFLDDRESDEVQLFYVPTYQCNFNCNYCYQDDYEHGKNQISQGIIRSFFRFVETHFADRKKYITLFGGEPLLISEKHRQHLESFLAQASLRKLDVAVVTNGYYLEEYIETLKKVSVREVQVTLDGLEATHDQRRPLSNGKGTFTKVVRGIDVALQANMPVNLRIVLDRENIHELPELADFAIRKGWTQSSLFKTQFGRNYELHHCQQFNHRLYSRIELYSEIYRLIKAHPQILEFHKPAFSISKFLFEEGKLPDPLFDSCPAVKTEWAFDYTGRVFACTATVGKTGEELGTYHPKISLNEDLIAKWEERDVLSMIECRQCSLQLACGGGCGAVSKNRTGKISSPDCRPVDKLISMGIPLYFRGVLD